jgi:hypothetical protein
MGTRSTTKILDEAGEPICVIYRQFDGYVAGHGQDIFTFLTDKNIVNGISSRTSEEFQFNGMTDLAIRLITYLKTKHGGVNNAGDFYLHNGSYPHSEGYDYVIYAKKLKPEADYYQNASDFKIALKCTSYGNVLFDDTIENLNLEEAETEDDE